MVPGNFGCGRLVLAMTAILAPSRAARRPMDSPMPRLAPVMNSVLPLRVAIGLHPAKNRPSIDRCSRGGGHGIHYIDRGGGTAGPYRSSRLAGIRLSLFARRPNGGTHAFISRS